MGTFKKKVVNRYERHFLIAIDYDLHVSEEEYTK